MKNIELQSAIKSLHEKYRFNQLHSNRDLRLFRTLQRTAGSKAIVVSAEDGDYRFSCPAPDKNEQFSYRFWRGTTGGLMQIRISEKGFELVSVHFDKDTPNQRITLDDYFLDPLSPQETEMNLFLMAFPKATAVLPSLVKAIPNCIAQAIKTHGKGRKL